MNNVRIKHMESSPPSHSFPCPSVGNVVSFLVAFCPAARPSLGLTPSCFFLLAISLPSLFLFVIYFPG